MRRLFWQLAYPFTVLGNRWFGASYKWVNVGYAAWHRELYDPLWHCEWFRDPIPSLPAEVNLCGILYETHVSDGLVQFVSRDFHSRIMFERDPHDVHAHQWYVDASARIPAVHVDTAYRWVEAVYGGSFERKAVAVRR